MIDNKNGNILVVIRIYNTAVFSHFVSVPRNAYTIVEGLVKQKPIYTQLLP